MQHAIHWFEIPVADLSRAIRFYETMTGATLVRETMGSTDEEMAIFPIDSKDGVHGCLLACPHAQPAQTGTTVYLNAEPSISIWLSRVEAAGSKILTPRTAWLEGMGDVAHILDNEGNPVGLHAMD